MSHYNLDQKTIAVTHATYAQLRKLRHGELNTFAKIIAKLLENKTVAVVQSNSERSSHSVQEANLP
jgi:hypothetical protein